MTLTIRNAWLTHGSGGVNGKDSSRLAGLPHLERKFDKLASAGYDKTSDATGYPPADGAYNCIAWAAFDTHHFWWPQPDLDWPFWSKRRDTVPAFVTAFRGLGYYRCDNARLEFGFEKVALYADGNSPKHMARQLRNGMWSSKCGGGEDITHFTLDALESYGPHPFKGHYGAPIVYMKRFIPVSWFVRFIQWTEWKIESSIWERLGSIVWKQQ
ncbi:MAG: hypothetical protein WBQ10_19115 [Terriglobales bacterium]